MGKCSHGKSPLENPSQAWEGQDWQSWPPFAGSGPTLYQIIEMLSCRVNFRCFQFLASHPDFRPTTTEGHQIIAMTFVTIASIQALAAGSTSTVALLSNATMVAAQASSTAQATTSPREFEISCPVVPTNLAE